MASMSNIHHNDEFNHSLYDLGGIIQIPCLLISKSELLDSTFLIHAWLYDLPLLTTTWRMASYLSYMVGTMITYI